MLDDFNVLSKRDPSKLLDFLDNSSITADFQSIDQLDIPLTSPKQIIVVTAGESTTAAWLAEMLSRDQLKVPLVVRDYYQEIPKSLSDDSLILIVDSLCRSLDGAIVDCYEKYRKANTNCSIIVVSSAESSADLVTKNGDTAFTLPQQTWPGMAVSLEMMAILKVLSKLKMISDRLPTELTDGLSWLARERSPWHSKSPTEENYAKQFALLATGKTAIFYGGLLTRHNARIFQLAWQVIAKNLAFTGTYPEFTHAEAASWTSHPIEKPFFTVDIMSNLESDETRKQMRDADRFLSGQKPKSYQLNLEGDSPSRQILWALALADYSATYLAILNNVRIDDQKILDKFESKAD